MTLFHKRRQDNTASGAGSRPAGEKIYSLGSAPDAVSALDAFSQAKIVAHAIAPNRRMFLVLSGQEFAADGTGAEWQFHYIYPDERVEAVVAVLTPPHSPIAGSAAIVETITPWPSPGSVQENMLQSQGPAARLVVEQQWNDRLDRLPGLPETFIDSPRAVEMIMNGGLDIGQNNSGLKLKGRTPPGGYPVWELSTGFENAKTPFNQI
jgi:hypothetical protein